MARKLTTNRVSSLGQYTAVRLVVADHVQYAIVLRELVSNEPTKPIAQLPRSLIGPLLREDRCQEDVTSEDQQLAADQLDVSELQVNIDKDRFEQELAYLLQKMDVDEELDRLQSHFVELQSILKRNEAVGRRLDFIMQEMNREANTINSKAIELSICQDALEVKSEVEKIREQVQNIE